MPSEETPLSAAALRRILAEEIHRKQIREELDGSAVRPSRLRRLLSGENLRWLMVTLVVPLTAFAWNWAETSRETARRDVAQLTALAPALTSDDERQSNIAKVILKRLVDSGAAAPALKAAYGEILVEIERGRRSADPDVQRSAVAGAEALARADTTGKAQIGAPAPVVAVDRPPPTAISNAPLPRVVYIQYYGEVQRPAVGRLATSLREAGIPVPGAENVLRTHPANAKRFPQRETIGVRFFHAEDRDVAAYVADLIRAALPDAPAPLLQRAAAPSVPRGQIEVWLPCQRDAAGRDPCA